MAADFNPAELDSQHSGGGASSRLLLLTLTLKSINKRERHYETLEISETSKTTEHPNTLTSGSSSSVQLKSDHEGKFVTLYI